MMNAWQHTCKEKTSSWILISIMFLLIKIETTTRWIKLCVIFMGCMQDDDDGRTYKEKNVCGK